MKWSDVFESNIIALSVQPPKHEVTSPREKDWQEYSCRCFRLLGDALKKLRSAGL